jgi:hypothetical protein
MATTYSTTTTLTELVPEIVAEALIILQAEAGIINTVRIKNTAGQPGLACDFPTYTEVPSSDVETPGENTANTNVVDLETNAHSASITEKVIVARISDLANKYTTDDLVESASMLFASALKAKLEDDIVNLFSGFSQTIAGAGTTLGEAHIWDAIRQIKQANGNTNNLVGVVSAKQYWGEKGIRKLIVTANADSGNLGEELKRAGFVSNAFGIDWFVSNEINEDVASGGDAAGAIYQRGAIGLHVKNILDVNVYKGSTGGEARYSSLVAVGEWGVIEVNDGWGVYALSDVS